MMQRTINTLLIILSMMVFWMIAIPQAYAAKPQTKAVTLYGYVDQNCIKNCVDPDVLWMAAEAAGKNHDVDPRLLIAIAKKESGFRPRARNGSQKGLVQTHMRYHTKRYEGRSPYDVYANLDVGGEILKECMREGRSIASALRCYNGGGTPGYVAATLSVYREVKKLRIHSS